MSQVNLDILGQLEALGFQTGKAIEALIKTENRSLDVAIDYILAHPPLEEKKELDKLKEERENKKPKVELPLHPTKLEDFKYDQGYTFDNNGELRHTETGEKFLYLNEEHYDAIGEQIIQYIQKKMKEDFQMDEVWLPLSVNHPTDPRCNIFLTKDALATSGKLMLIIQGVGKVRAGQWGRKLCFNDSLNTGSMLPYLERAKREGYAIIVFNPNYNFEMRMTSANKLEKVMISGNETPEDHVLYVWERFVRKSTASKIFIVAHSFGGTATLNLVEKRESEFLKRVTALVLTDSVMYFSHRIISKQALSFFQNRSCNWMVSDLPLDTPIYKDAECMVVSAGHKIHENTSSSCMDSVFKFFSANDTK